MGKGAKHRAHAFLVQYTHSTWASLCSANPMDYLIVDTDGVPKCSDILAPAGGIIAYSFYRGLQ